MARAEPAWVYLVARGADLSHWRLDDLTAESDNGVPPALGLVFQGAWSLGIPVLL